MSDPKQKKAPGEQAGSKFKGGKNSTQDSRTMEENYNDSPESSRPFPEEIEYFDRSHGRNQAEAIGASSKPTAKAQPDNKTRIGPGPTDKEIIPFYGADDCGHIHDYDCERGLLGCVFLDPGPTLPIIQDLGIPNPTDLFADKRHKIIYKLANAEHWKLYGKGSGLDLITFKSALKREVEAGRIDDGVISMTYVSDLQEAVHSTENAPSYLGGILEKYKQRKFRQSMQRHWTGLSSDPNGASDADEELERVVSEIEELRSLSITKNKKVNFVSWDEITSYEAPEGYLLTDHQFLCRGEISIVAGYPGTGKSMFSLWLAALAAMGEKEFMGHQLLTRFRTMILQNENGLFPLKQRLQGIQERFPDFDFNSWVQISEPPQDGMTIANPEFKRAFKSAIRDFDPGLVIIDPFTNLVDDLGHRDYREALTHIRDVIPNRPDQPAILIVAHCRKKNANAKKARGRALLNEVIGSQVLVSQIRSAWGLDAVSDNQEDNRVVVQDIKNNNGEMVGPSAWERNVGWFEELPDFDMEEYYSSDTESATGNAKDEKALEILHDISSGDPTGFNKWHDACKAEGIYKGKTTFSNAVKRLREANRIQQNEVSKLYQIVMEPGAFGED